LFLTAIRMAQPRKHHYLPQFYLRGFSADERSIYQIEKLTGRHYGCQIKDTAAVRDFHEIDLDGIQDPHILEKSLAQVEAQLAEDLRSFLTEGISNAQALSGVVDLLSQLRMSIPAFKQHIDRSMTSNIRAVAEMLERTGQLPEPPPGHENILRVENLKISVANWKCLEIMFDMAAAPDMLNIFRNMRATLYRCTGNDFFVTCDQPVALLHPTLAANNPYGIGPAMKGVEISLPLSASALLKLDHETGPHSEAVATSVDVKEFNRRTTIMAQSYIFTSDRPEMIAQQSALLRNTFAGFRFEDINPGGQRFQIHRFIGVPVTEA
jgi:hypothetical protein